MGKSRPGDGRDRMPGKYWWFGWWGPGRHNTAARWRRRVEERRWRRELDEQ